MQLLSSKSQRRLSGGGGSGSSSSKKKRAELLQRLEKVWNKPENQYCIDCDEKNTSWASILAPIPTISGSKKMAVFCCYKCCNYHMTLGRDVCLVKNLKTANDWTEEEIKILESCGNDILNVIYEGNLAEPKPSPNEYDEQQRFIEQKYKKLKFFCKKTYEAHHGFWFASYVNQLADTMVVSTTTTTSAATTTIATPTVPQAVEAPAVTYGPEIPPEKMYGPAASTKLGDSSSGTTNPMTEDESQEDNGADGAPDNNDNKNADELLTSWQSKTNQQLAARLADRRSSNGAIATRRRNSSVTDLKLQGAIRKQRGERRSAPDIRELEENKQQPKKEEEEEEEAIGGTEVKTTKEAENKIKVEEDEPQQQQDPSLGMIQEPDQPGRTMQGEGRKGSRRPRRASSIMGTSDLLPSTSKSPSTRRLTRDLPGTSSSHRRKPCILEEEGEGGSIRRNRRSDPNLFGQHSSKSPSSRRLTRDLMGKQQQQQPTLATGGQQEDEEEGGEAAEVSFRKSRRSDTNLMGLLSDSKKHTSRSPSTRRLTRDLEAGKASLLNGSEHGLMNRARSSRRLSAELSRSNHNNTSKSPCAQRLTRRPSGRRLSLAVNNEPDRAAKESTSSPEGQKPARPRRPRRPIGSRRCMSMDMETGCSSSSEHHHRSGVHDDKSASPTQQNNLAPRPIVRNNKKKSTMPRKSKSFTSGQISREMRESIAAAKEFYSRKDLDIDTSISSHISGHEDAAESSRHHHGTKQGDEIIVKEPTTSSTTDATSATEAAAAANKSRRTSMVDLRNAVSIFASLDASNSPLDPLSLLPDHHSLPNNNTNKKEGGRESKRMVDSSASSEGSSTNNCNAAAAASRRADRRSAASKISLSSGVVVPAEVNPTMKRY